MPDTEYTRLFQLARERALSGFEMLCQRLVREAEESIAHALPEARSAPERNALSSARQILSRGGGVFLKRCDALFRNYLERAMRTMYTDLRPDLATVSADDLSLIDDETVHRQVEVNKLVLRMRNENQECIGRLNVVVAQLHGDRDARERENPFRPYLLARSLHEAVKDVAGEDAAARALFAHLSEALVRNFPLFYAGVLGVFEASGIRAQFAAQPSRLVPGQRYFGSIAFAPEPLSEQFSARVLPGMLRMMELARAPLARGAQAGEAGALQDFMRAIFAPRPVQGNGMPAPAFAPASQGLIAELGRYQSAVARGETTGAAAPERNQLFALQEGIAPGKASREERVIIDVVAMLFEYVLEDEKIPAALRGQLGRLQVPFLKAALLEPGLLQDPAHPARQLLNRLCTAAVGSDRATQPGAAIVGEIRRVVSRIIGEFDGDTGIFADMLAEFERFLEKELHAVEDDLVACARALAHAEKAGMLASAVAASLADIMAPLRIDARISAFICGVWSRVLADAFLRDASGAAWRQYRDLLADLVWSVQEMQDAQERSELMRLLPELVKRLKSGLHSIRLPEKESRTVLDQLVELHMQAMRAGIPKKPQEHYSIAALRQRFALLRLEEAADARDAALSGPDRIEAAVVDAALLQETAAASIHIDPDAPPPGEEEAQSLAQIPFGACLECRSGSDRGPSESRLVWVSPRRLLYLFAPGTSGGWGKPAVYDAPTLLRRLRDGDLRPLEYAPVFERAVQSLLARAASVQRAS